MEKLFGYNRCVSLREFTDSYIEAALWSSHTSDGTPLDRDHSAEDIQPDTLRTLKQDAALFYGYYKDVIAASGRDDADSHAGHDFWLTQNGHGAGFWDGDWPKDIGKLLTEASKTFGEHTLDAAGGEVFSIDGGGREPQRIRFSRKKYKPSGPPEPPHPAHQGGILDWFPKKGKKGNSGLGISAPEPKFKSPQIVMTPGAEDAISRLEEEHDRDVIEYLDRHFRGDWGEVPKEDAAQNDAMILEKGMILSAYTLPTGTKIWIITDPGHKTTTILLPEEY